MAYDTVTVPEPRTSSVSRSGRIWLVIISVIVILSLIFRMALLLAALWTATYLYGSPGCSDPSHVPGYAEVTAAGYRYECLDSMPMDITVFGSNSSVDALGVTDVVAKRISILNTDGDETFAQTHETGHALSDIYQDTTAQAYYLTQTGLDHWNETSADDYWTSGTESFAETYAVCRLHAFRIKIPFTSIGVVLPYGLPEEYVVSSCETLDATLKMMKESG